ncbi:uroporphyrinogen-III C-methyltransferase [Dermacoccaceae bacterium W4C1]
MSTAPDGLGVPLWVDLRDRRVVAVGGGPVSARRVRMLVDAGAAVTVIAPFVCEDLSESIEAGELAWWPRDYAGREDLEGAWLVHTATGDSTTDAAVVTDAEALRILCVDATRAGAGSAAVPARAQVPTPDGMVAAAVHTSGDPRRAMAVRDDLRRTLADTLELGGADLRRRRTRERGWVALVGGGPGDPGLLTVRARTLLASADVVVTDRLVGPAVLGLIPQTARVIDVGKTPGRHPIPQPEINRILIQEAQAGHGVVRLKGGDPYVLGRGGEERIACAEHGIDVEVVPGVTSAVSVPAAAGIPVTHRGVARGFTVVTGHEEIPELPTGADHTLVILMGVTQLRRTAELLIEHGRCPDTPAAVVERGFAPDQRTTIAPLAEIASAAEEIGATSPAVIVVGDVVALADDPRS